MLFRQYLKQISTKTIPEIGHFVVGNQSADYDTFFGSIIMAYLLTTATKNMHIPIMDCQVHEIPYRFEIFDVLKRLNINHEQFKYRDAFKEVTEDSWYHLYDHNERPNLKNIHYIIDHHDFSKPNAKKYLITKMGSDLTHLYYLMNPSKLPLVEPQTQDEHAYKQIFNDFVDGEPWGELAGVEKVEKDVQYIMRYGIMMDTFNFDPAQRQRWTIYDKKAVQFIEQHQEFQINYDYLLELKFNVDLNKNLSLEAALAKDYKSFDYGNFVVEYSFIYLQPEIFYKHYQPQIQKWLALQPPTSDIYMLMSVFKENDQLQRSFMFYIKNQNEEYRAMLQSFLKLMKMQPIDTDNFQSWHLWRDPSCKMSRKVFDKAFRQYYSEWSAKKQ